MPQDTRQIARKLVRVQQRLRKELLEELNEHGAELDEIFDPYSFSPLVQEIREKYINRLQVLQIIIQQLAHLRQGRRQPPVKVLSLSAQNSQKLVKRVNHKLEQLNGARVINVEFLENEQEEQWEAMITYMANPFTEAQDETAAFM